MSPHLTIAYFTSRKNPMTQWFAGSLDRELNGNYDGVKVIVVDFWAQIPEYKPFRTLWVQPKPTVWQGPHRLTKADYFAAANARNTAICLAPDGWVAFVDDLSWLAPGWLKAVREAMAGGYIACGAYRKVKDMAVANDQITFTPYPHGEDRRWPHGHDTKAVPCHPGWLYGCSLAAPVEAFLKINGYPEACDGMGYEDSVTGMTIAKHGYEFRYDRRMLTYESEEFHQQLPIMLREDPCRGDTNASPRDDMSHAMLRIFKDATRFENYFGPGGIRELRQRVLAGEPFPVMAIPQHRWFDMKPLSELPENVP